MHVQHIRVDGVAHSDLTGVLAFAAGLVLAGLAVVLLWHRRPLVAARCSPCRSRSSARSSCSARWRIGMIEAHKWREPIGAKPGPELPGGRVPLGRRPEAHRLVPPVAATARPSCSCTAATATARAPSGTPRCWRPRATASCSTTPAAAVTARARPNGYGWDWRKDVAGAMAFLKARPTSSRAASARSGLSTGADVLVEVAADRDDIARDRRRRHGGRELRGLAPAARRRGRRGAGLDHVQDDRGALGRPAEPRARGPRSARPASRS